MNTLLKIKLFVFLFFFNLINVFSQNNQVIAPSPTASALGKYVDNPVSLYTGTPQISIPLYDLKVKDFTLPVNLSYHAGGIKVEETASNIGLGWVLNAGGVITRVVRDVPDDYIAPNCPKEYYGSGPEPDCRDGILKHGKNVHDIDLQAGYLQDANNSKYSAENIFDKFFSITNDGSSTSFEKIDDSEPDIFYFNFCGKSGKFVFEVINGRENIKLLSHEDLKITHFFDSDGRISKFTVVDDLGIVYQFEDVETTISLVESQSPYPVLYPTGNGIYWSAYPIGFSSTSFNSAWNLTKIITPTGSEIKFTYKDELTSLLNNGAEQTSYHLLSVDYDPNVPRPNGKSFHDLIVYNRTNFNGKRLSAIESRDAKIEFSSDLIRKDVWGYEAEKLPKIINGLTVYSKQLQNLNRIKKIVFNQDYFESPIVSIFSVGDTGYYHTPPQNTDITALINLNMNVYFKRLRLRSVTELGISDSNVNPPTQFEYKYDGFAGYNSNDRLPHRFSKQQDLWGFYNGAQDNTTSIPKLYVYPDMYSDSRRFSVFRKVNYTGREYIISGGNRLPSESLIDVGTLTKIVYPTGGYTKFEYETHKFREGVNEFIGGGLRIKKITKHDGLANSADVISDYTYNKADGTSSGEIISMPIFAVCDGQGSKQAPLDNSSNSFKMNTTRFSQPQAPLGTTQGSNVGYRMVTESMSGNGKSIYEYAMPALWNDSNDLSFPNPQADCSIDENGDCNNLYKATPVYNIFPYTTLRTSDFNQSMNQPTINSYPFPENPNYDWNRGQLLFKKQYNNLGKLLNVEKYNYSIKYFNGQTAPSKVFGLKFGSFFPAYKDTEVYYNIVAFRAAKYYYLTDVAKVLSSKVITEYFANGDELTKTIAYRYDGISHKNITKITEDSNVNEKRVKTFKYAPDYSNFAGPQEGVYALKNKNISSVPVEEINYVEKSGVENLVGSNLTTYSLVNNIALPDRVFKLEGGLPFNNFQPSSIDGPGVFSKDSRYAEKFKYKRYDSFGNILEVEDKVTGLITSYVWGYDNLYPVAKVDNATYDNVATALGSADLGSLNKGANAIVLTDLQTRTILTSLRTKLPNAQVSTYTYKPLVGITSVTDPKGISTFYDYDDFNRLSFVRDHNFNILERYCYNYKGQQTDCTPIHKVFLSVSKMKTYTRDNCAPGGKPDTGVYVVATGKYSSTISQADADAKAQYDVDRNGQAHVNSTADCNFYNTGRTANFTTDNCEKGKIGSVVSFNQAAGTIRSTTSQAHADALALERFDRDGQNYANAHGNCFYLNSREIRGVFTKNNCSIGYYAQPYTYIIAANSVQSYTSQEEANQFAQAKLDSNGQAEANRNSICRAVEFSVEENYDVELLRGKLVVILKASNGNHNGRTFNLKVAVYTESGFDGYVEEQLELSPGAMKSGSILIRVNGRATHATVVSF